MSCSLAFAYLAVAIISASVGCGELVGRYRDTAWEVLRCALAKFYVAVNAVAGMAALLTIDAFDWTFGADTVAQQQILCLFTAAITSMAVLRSSVFTMSIDGTDVHAGPNALIKTILDAADRAVDRERAQRRSLAVQEIMKDVSFDRAKDKLPSDCFTLMQNVKHEEQADVNEELESLKADKALGDKPRARQLGLVLMKVVGEDVLRESVAALNSEIKEKNVGVASPEK